MRSCPAWPNQVKLSLIVAEHPEVRLVFLAGISENINTLNAHFTAESTVS